MTRCSLVGLLVTFASAASVFATLTIAAPSADARRRVVVYGPRPRGRVYASGFVFVPGNWYGGVGLFATRIIDQRGGPEQIEHGAGLSVYGGLRVNERLSLEATWLGSAHNPATVSNGYYTETDYLILEGLTADAKIHLDRSGQLDPYLQGGVGVYFLGREHFGIDAVGTGFQLGGGFDYWLADHWTLGLRLRYHGISMAPPEGNSGDNTYISAITAEGSLALRF
jgi:opacity protein-like surface antigen